jgi:hypothetical protein
VGPSSVFSWNRRPELFFIFKSEASLAADVCVWLCIITRKNTFLHDCKQPTPVSGNWHCFSVYSTIPQDVPCFQAVSCVWERSSLKDLDWNIYFTQCAVCAFLLQKVLSALSWKTLAHTALSCRTTL